MAHNILEGYTRVFVEEHEVERTSSFYQDLLDGTETQRFSYPEKHLTIATVRSPQLSILIVGGSEEHRAPFAASHCFRCLIGFVYQVAAPFGSDAA